MTRLSRKEKQAETRRCLMHSAAKIFASRGLHQTSIDAVAEDAGFTRGAFYANFANKQELFLAMLDERFTTRLEEIERVIADEDSIEHKTERVGDEVSKVLAADPEWNRIFFEFSAYAARDDAFREELLTRYTWMRERLAAALRSRAIKEGIAVESSMEQIAMMTCMMANGFALEKMLDPEQTPDELFGGMLSIFFTGLLALAPQAEGAAG